jgi:translation elongation factor EF-Tu-like GTPase
MVDDVDMIDLLKKKLEIFLKQARIRGDETPIIRGSALKALKIQVMKLVLLSLSGIFWMHWIHLFQFL